MRDELKGARDDTRTHSEHPVRKREMLGIPDSIRLTKQKILESNDTECYKPLGDLNRPQSTKRHWRKDGKSLSSVSAERRFADSPLTCFKSTSESTRTSPCLHSTSLSPDYSPPGPLHKALSVSDYSTSPAPRRCSDFWASDDEQFEDSDLSLYLAHGLQHSELGAKLTTAEAILRPSAPDADRLMMSKDLAFAALESRVQDLDLTNAIGDSIASSGTVFVSSPSPLCHRPTVYRPGHLGQRWVPASDAWDDVEDLDRVPICHHGQK